MFNLSMTLGALLHASLLIGVIVFVCRHWKIPRQDWPFIVFILFWAVLVLGSQIASAMQALNQLTVYIPATFEIGRAHV